MSILYAACLEQKPRKSEFPEADIFPSSKYINEMFMERGKRKFL